MENKKYYNFHVSISVWISHWIKIIKEHIVWYNFIKWMDKLVGRSNAINCYENEIKIDVIVIPFYFWNNMFADATVITVNEA